MRSSLTLTIPVGTVGNEIIFTGSGDVGERDSRTLAIDPTERRIELEGRPIDTTLSPLPPTVETLPSDLLLTTGSDVLQGGSQNDRFFAVDGELGEGDRLNGADGFDRIFHIVNLSADYVFGTTTAIGIEKLLILDEAKGPRESISYTFSEGSNEFREIELRGGGSDFRLSGVLDETEIFLNSLRGLQGPVVEIDYKSSSPGGALSTASLTLINSDIWELNIVNTQDAPSSLVDTLLISAVDFSFIRTLKVDASTLLFRGGEFSKIQFIADIPGSVSLVRNEGLGSVDLRLGSATGPVNMSGGEGAEHYTGGDFDDVIVTRGGPDHAVGGFGNDHIDTGDGNDFVGGGPGNDVVLTGAGDDQVVDGDGDDFFDLGDGNDTLEFGFGRNTIFMGAGDDTLREFPDVSPRFDAGDTDGLPQNLIDFGSGRDRLILGHGTDDARFKNITPGSLEEVFVQFNSSPQPYVLGLEAQEAGVDTVVLFGASSDILLDASQFSRSLTIRANLFWTVLGGSGDDIIEGRGRSTLSGGEGADTFFYRNIVTSPPGSPNDTILDFQSGVDRIDIRQLDRFFSQGLTIDYIGTFGTLEAAYEAIAAGAGDRMIEAAFVNGPDLLIMDFNDNGVIEDAEMRINLVGVDRISGEDVFSGSVVDSPLFEDTASFTAQSVDQVRIFETSGPDLFASATRMTALPFVEMHVP